MHRCTHIYLSMWWLYQEHESLLKEEGQSGSEESSLEDGVECVDDQDDFSGEQLEKMTTYLCEHKKIPEVLPPSLRKIDLTVPDSFEPAETVCPYCPGPTYPDLSEAKTVTRNATVYGLYSVTKGLWVVWREKKIYRYIKYIK